MATTKQQRKPSTPRRVRFQLLGHAAEKGHVLLADFVRQLDALRAALRATDEALGTDDTKVTWRVVDLEHNSPATIVLEEVVTKKSDGRATPRVAAEFGAVLGSINRRGTIATARKDIAALETYRELAMIAMSGAERATLTVGRNRVDLGPKFLERLEKVIGPDETIDGSVMGTLDAVNLHVRPTFTIWPIVGPRRVSCRFDGDDLRKKTIDGLGRYVEVTGKLHYKSWAQFPHAITVEGIEILPESRDLPTLSSLRGIAPDLTGDESSNEFVQRIRDEW